MNCNMPAFSVNPEYTSKGVVPEAEAPIFGSPDAKSRLTGKDPDAGKGWGQEKKEVTKDKMAGRHHWLYEHEFEQTLGESEVQGSLACC